MLLKGRLIFIVEDNVDNRVVFRMALVRHGAQIEYDRWGSNSVPYLLSLSAVDLILLDLNLANGISGFDVYDQIRAAPRLSSIPIAAVTAMDPALVLEKVRSKGFSGFFAKPIDSVRFGEQLARIINGEHLWCLMGDVA